MVKLLTSNAKLEKCLEFGYLARGLQLLPGNKSGREFCPDRGACFATCLDTSGMGSFPGVKSARLERSKMFNQDRKIFLHLLNHELESLESTAHKRGLKPAARLNTFSDLPWEEFARTVFADHPGVQFYDYTKSRERAARSLRDSTWPSNYDLTFSWSEKATHQFGTHYLKGGGRIAVVGRLKEDPPHSPRVVIPRFMRSHGQVDGDEHDLTFIQPKGCVLVLSPKGKLTQQQTRFA